ncbi:MAG: DNA repair protein RadA, partial [Syntrophobacterales bacterium]|nr:DNA repair protein RadA [Syntrophobacterales bacterium]
MKRTKTTFFCQNCGHQSAKWLGKCPSCGEWNQFVEEEMRDISPGDSREGWFNEEPISID